MKEITNKLTSDFLSKLFLFEKVNDKDLEIISKKLVYEIKTFEGGEKIYTPEGFEKKVGFIIEGECLVERIKSDGNAIPLNTLSNFDSFGILAVFSCEDRYPTQILSKKKTTILFLEEKTVLALTKEYYEVSLSIINFMSRKIDFLNKKVATFSADSVEEKIALYLLSESKRQKTSCVILNFSHTAKILNSGRASVYRALDALENLSLIKVENKKIYINDPTGLERVSK
jgi:CRP-like cAMP-binding protein